MSRRVAAGVVIGVVGIAALASIASAALTVAFARAVVTPPKKREEPIRVIGVTASTVTLSETKDSTLPGRYGLWFARASGYARIGDIIATGRGVVTRQLIAVDYGDLRAGVTARLNAWFYLGPRELGYPYENVLVATELGPAPAWLIPAERETGRWVINVHGRAVRRSETLRAVPVFREAGYTSLLVSYRNDEDAPDSGDKRYALGDAEWRDVEAAIDYAVANGALEVVLMGWSMGGAIVLQAATRSTSAGVVSAVVLDSPVIDWASVLGFQAAQLRLPPATSRAALRVLGNAWGARLTGQAESIDLDRLDFVARAADLHRPILLMHSDDDGYVPSTASRRLALARTDLVTFEAFSVARHTKLWNYDAQRWNVAIAAFLANLPAHSSGRTGHSRRQPEAG